MAKTAHSTTAPAPAQPGFIDPTTLPDEYAMRVRGDCLAPAINAGDAVLVDQRQPYAPGDLVCVFLKPECSGGTTNVGLKRILDNLRANEVPVATDDLEQGIASIENRIRALEK